MGIGGRPKPAKRSLSKSKIFEGGKSELSFAARHLKK
jgi:hypothetical protein